MRTPTPVLFVVFLASLGCAPPPREDPATLHEQVVQTERAFARTMADRDLDDFRTFLAGETVFFSGQTPIRGREAVAETWARYFQGDTAPFSWEPEVVEVLDSGNLALSTGPVRDPSGILVGTFTSIWRREAPGIWRIVFDKGCEVCEPSAP